MASSLVLFIGQLTWHNRRQKKPQHLFIRKGQVNPMNFEIRFVQGHVEVYDGQGRFLFSADTQREAIRLLQGGGDDAA